MRRMATAVAIGMLLVAAVAVQVSVLSRLDLPAATPDLVLVVTGALGCRRGPSFGATAGFVGGLVLDLAPPADHAAGQWALVLTVVGYLAGRFGTTRAATPASRIGLVAALAAGGTLAYVAVSAVLGAGWPAVGDAGPLALGAAAYGAVLATVVLPATGWLLDRVTPVPGRW